MKLAVKQQVILDATSISYTLIRRPRKSIGLKVTQTGLELRVPFACPERMIHQTLSRHAKWIIAKLAQIPQSCILSAGQTISWLGNILLIVPDAASSHLTRTACHLAAQNAHTDLYTALVILYKKMALPFLQERTQFWARKMQLTPKRILLSSANTSWGSCNRRGEIRLSWRLMQFCADCIDYVIIHELAHLREMNHSHLFWQLVSQYCPDYTQTRKQLKALPYCYFF